MIGLSDRTFLRALALPVAALGVMLGGSSMLLVFALSQQYQAIWTCLVQPIVAGHFAVHLSLVLGAVAATLVGVRQFYRWQSRQTQFAGTSINSATGTPTNAIFGLEHLLRRLGVGEQTHLFASDLPSAFVRGLLRPRIYLSTGIIALLTLEELEAVILHERWHALRRDPLRLAIVNALTRPFQRFAGVQQLVHTHALAVEVEADHFVVERMQTSRWVAAAMLRLINSYEKQPGVAFASLIDSRIAALAGGNFETVERFSIFDLMLLALGALGFCVVAMSFLGTTWPLC